MSSRHDASYKQLFSNPLMIRSLFEGILQAASPNHTLPSAEDLDWSGAEPLPTNFINKQLRQRSADCIWRIPRKNGPDLHLLLLLEFQSSKDIHMALRITTYVLLLYELLIKQQRILPGQAYPAILPVVLYSGLPPWTAATRLADKINTIAVPWSDIVPNGGYILIDEGELLRQGRLPKTGLMNLLVRLEHCQSIEQFQELVQTVIKHTAAPAYDQARHALLEWVKHELWQRNVPHHPVGHIRNFEEFTAMLIQERVSWTDKIRIEGKEEGRAEGRELGQEQGRTEGQAAMLERLLIRKFGSVPQYYSQLIKAATTAELEVWALNFVDATTLDDIFAK